MNRFFFFFIILSTALISCSTSPPENLLDEDTYINIFLELAILDQYDPLLLEQAAREEYQEKIFERYGITYEDFRISHNYYEQFIQDQIERTDRASQLLRAERDSIHQHENEYRNQKRLRELAEEQEASEDHSSNN